MDLKKLFKEYNISLSDLQCEMFDKYFNFLIQENEKYNLTGITEKNEVYIKHFLDSVLPADVFKSNSNMKRVYKILTKLHKSAGIYIIFFNNKILAFC